MSRMRAIASTGLLALACGSVDLFPLWVKTDVLVADVDGDGRADIVTLAMLSTSMSHSEGRLVVYRQTTPGIFAPPESYVVGLYPWKLAIGDVDGDGLPDLLVTDVDSRAVWLLPQNPLDRGRFLGPRALVSVAGPGAPYEIAIADLDGDGSPEIAVTIAGTSGLLLHQDPAHAGTFAPATDLGLLRSSSNVKAGDIDGDGRADLFASVYLPETDMAPNVELAVVLQRADGTLGPPTVLSPQHGLNVYMVAVADYDGDGRNDLFAFFSPSKAGFEAKLTVLLQGPQPGTFSPPIDTSLAAIAGRDDAVVADLDGDGRADVAVVGFFPVGSPTVVHSRLNLFRQSGAGAFALAGVYEMPVAVSRVAAGDVDGDGLNDLVVLGGDDEVMLLRQSSISHGTLEAPRRLP